MDNLPCWPDKHMYFHSMELYYYECKVQILFCTKIQLSQVLYWICSGPQVFVFSSISAKIETLPWTCSSMIHLSLSLAIHLVGKNFGPSEAKVHLEYCKWKRYYSSRQHKSLLSLVLKFFGCHFEFYWISNSAFLFLRHCIK